MHAGMGSSSPQAWTGWKVQRKSVWGWMIMCVTLVCRNLTEARSSANIIVFTFDSVSVSFDVLILCLSSRFMRSLFVSLYKLNTCCWHAVRLWRSMNGIVGCSACSQTKQPAEIIWINCHEIGFRCSWSSEGEHICITVRFPVCPIICHFCCCVKLTNWPQKSNLNLWMFVLSSKRMWVY